MSIKSSIKRAIESNTILLEIKFALLKPLHWLSYVLKRNPNERSVVEHGAASVMRSPEYARIPRVPDAGRLVGGLLVMHNGVRVLPTSYIGWPNYVMLRGSGGVHEPEEERVFMDVLATLPAGATMVELGAYWAFYSLWFQQVVPGARSILVEPELSHLNYGRKHFQINGRTGTFVHALVGAREGTLDGHRIVSVDALVREHGLDRIDLLHADIQGYELEMLEGASATLAAQKIGWAFISTHSEDLHARCRELLARHGFVVAAEALQSQISGPDGVLVMRHESVPDPGVDPIRLAATPSA